MTHFHSSQRILPLLLVILFLLTVPPVESVRVAVRANGETSRAEEEIYDQEDTTTNSTFTETHATSNPTRPNETSATSAKLQSTRTNAQHQLATNPYVSLLGPELLSITFMDNSNGTKTARLQVSETSEMLKGKEVVGLYFSADWYDYYDCFSATLCLY